jgi:undecaprenyl-diphosphatase
VTLWWIAVVLGVVEGLTEFIPVSSTGHLILANSLLRFGGPKAAVFAIVIQLGAILAVVWEYRSRLARAVLDLPARPGARRFAASLAIAFLPAAVLGLLADDWIEAHLFGPRTVAFALLAGAGAILAVEARPLPARTAAAEDVTPGQALAIGLAQCVSLWPGFSRSAATILGGLAAGLDRRAATEFSFFLAIPIMFAASGYSLVKHRDVLVDPRDVGALALSFAVAFLVAWASIRWLLRFVSAHRFTPFAWYRIALGAVVLWLLA